MAEKYRAKFGGLPQEEEAAPKVKGGKKSKAAAVAPGPDVPRTPEILALEAKIAEQGDAVRALKGQLKTPEVDVEIKAAVDLLKKLKGELAALLHA